ncbi:hypothetical protein HNQ44_002377 [Planomicrobium koreense]|uniref:Uncharacterized protein n=1 Tax=Planococcus koreensis TaxID=112331 RepID=A0A7W8CVB8_9BACL|nr:hypothetical protein [Planococcus koreensis]
MVRYAMSIYIEFHDKSPEVCTQKKESIQLLVALSKEKVEFQVLKSFPGTADMTTVQFSG